MSEPRRVLVTGAGGFIGGHLCRRLSELGMHVRGLSRDLRAVPSGSTPVQLDEDWRRSLAVACRGVDVVVHCAGRAHVMRERAGDPSALFRHVNVDLTRELLTASAEAGVSRLVLLSSVAVLGRPESGILDSATPVAPTTPYGITKLEAEELVCKAGQDWGLETTILRPPMVYGPGMKGNSLRLFQLLKRGYPLPLASIRNQRSLLYVDNLAAAVASVLGSPKCVGRCFLVADAETISTPDLVRLIAQGFGRPPRLFPVPSRILKVFARVGDLGAAAGLIGSISGALARLTETLIVDASALTSTTGARPPVSLEAGVLATARGFAKYLREVPRSG